jgi:hypothetical protein
MIDLGQYIHTAAGRFVVSGLLGVGLAAVFKEYMFGPNRMQFITTTDAVDEQAIYKWNGIYYKVRRETVTCESLPSKPIIPLR